MPPLETPQWVKNHLELLLEELGAMPKEELYGRLNDLHKMELLLPRKSIRHSMALLLYELALYTSRKEEVPYFNGDYFQSARGQ